MSSKLRLTFWITLMVLLLAAMLILFLFASERVATANYPAGRLVDIVDRNANALETERGLTEWHHRSSHILGVFCAYYDENGKSLYGAMPDESLPELPFQQHVIRTVKADDGSFFYVYDSFAQTENGGIWVRGVVSTADASGLRTTILIIAFSLLPVLLLITVGIRS